MSKRREPFRRSIVVALACAAVGAALGGCDNMSDDSRLKPLETNAFFPDGRSARELVPGTVPRNALDSGAAQSGADANDLPFPLTRQVLRRGQQRYEIFCGVCHGATGAGDGMIVLRGFTPPPSLHEPRVREKSLGHYVDVISNGWGAMYSYSDRVDWEDRWAIAAYIRALQLSRRVPADWLGGEEVNQARGNQP